MTSTSNFSVLPRDGGREVLLLSSPEGWALPAHTASAPHAVTAALCEVTGIVSPVVGTVSELTGPDGTSTLIAHEGVAAGVAAPEGGRWVRAADLDPLDLAGTHTRAMLDDWFGGVRRGTAVPGAPWCRDGWFESAAEWMTARLTEHGTPPAGPVEQFLTSPWSCTLRVPMGDGSYSYFKAAPPVFHHEAALTALVGRWHPDWIVPVVAVDSERGWMLSADIGDATYVDPVTTDADLPYYRRSIERYARIQRTALEHLPELRRLGIPDRTLAALPDLYDDLLSDPTVLMVGEDGGLSEDEHRALLGFADEFRSRCERLAAFDLPETLVNVDFWHGNVSFRDRGDIIFDWAEVGIAHPMFSLTTVTREFEVWEVPDGDRLRAELEDVYLTTWRDREPEERIREAYDLARPGAILCRAQCWRDSISTLGDLSRYRHHRRAVVVNLSRILPLIKEPAR